MNCTDAHWFKTWFDSPYYHILYKHRDEDEAKNFINNLIQFLKPHESSRFLDLACGKGRHSFFLNKKGFDVTGVDLSPESIKLALTKENERLRFFVHDMRNPLKENQFDYVFNLFTSFGYFENDEDNQSTITAVSKGLKKDGIFLIDFFNANKVIANLRKEEIVEREGISFCINRKVQDGFIVKQISFSDAGNDYVFEERVKALLLSDFEKYLSTSGLNILHLWGDYHLTNFNVDSSDRLIIAAKK